MNDIVAEHHAMLRARSSRSWAAFTRGNARRELTFAVVLALCAATALVSVMLLIRYFGTIPVEKETTVTDRFGQVIGRTGAITRVPAETAAHSVVYRFITDSFSVYNSPNAMRENYKEALSFVSSDTVKQTMEDIWNQGPLKQNGAWVEPQAETQVVITSILQRGQPSRDGTEYDVQWTTQNVLAPSPPSARVLYDGDLILTSGGQVTDADTGGLVISHFSFGRMK